MIGASAMVIACRTVELFYFAGILNMNVLYQCISSKAVGGVAISLPLFTVVTEQAEKVPLGELIPYI